ncbi:hypothetical protein HPB49_022781 [Dermacentor silvarum]|uniref:Uncharacterized protein n=1 Tax=Dermacentor silvarum TaxID=543639 RepID=A0ACB8DLB0_DERSI|nr:hypothetical protein HPB49_022781 [Dermacentor silvarum]
MQQFTSSASLPPAILRRNPTKDSIGSLDIFFVLTNSNFLTRSRCRMHLTFDYVVITSACLRSSGGLSFSERQVLTAAITLMVSSVRLRSDRQPPADVRLPPADPHRRLRTPAHHPPFPDEPNLVHLATWDYIKRVHGGRRRI